MDTSNLQTTEVVVGMIIFFTARAWSSKMLFGDSVVGNQAVYHLACIIWIRLRIVSCAEVAFVLFPEIVYASMTLNFLFSGGYLFRKESRRTLDVRRTAIV